MATASADNGKEQKPAPFLSLPVELRLRIYELVLSNEYARLRWHQGPQDCVPITRVTSPLYVNSRIYHEFLPIFYRTFTFDPTRIPEESNFEGAISERSARISHPHLHLMRSIKIEKWLNLTTSNVGEYRQILQMLDDSSNLKFLHLETTAFMYLLPNEVLNYDDHLTSVLDHLLQRLECLQISRPGIRDTFSMFMQELDRMSPIHAQLCADGPQIRDKQDDVNFALVNSASDFSSTLYFGPTVKTSGHIVSNGTLPGQIALQALRRALTGEGEWRPWMGNLTGLEERP